MRILVFSEYMTPPWDEGFKKLARALAQTLAKSHPVLALTAHGVGSPGIARVHTNRLLLSPDLWRRLRAFRPQVILYVPTASVTPYSFLRARLLRLQSPGARVALVGLQPRPQTPFSRLAIRLLSPDLLCVQSARTRAGLPPLSCPVIELPSGVDLEHYRPVDAATRAALRVAHDVSPTDLVILHAGHVKAERNVGVLAQLTGPGRTVILLGSTSTPAEPEEIARLRAAGVRVILETVPDLEAYYQMADVYVFPTPPDRGAAIDLPLSVIEAMACDLPVVTTPFGGLPAHFPAGSRPGLRYVAPAGDWAGALVGLPPAGVAGTRELVTPYSWDAVAGQLLHALQTIML